MAFIGRRPLIIVATVILVAGVFSQTKFAFPLYPHGKSRALAEQRDSVTVRFAYPEFGRSTIDAAIGQIMEGAIGRAVISGSGSEDFKTGPSTLTASYAVVYRTWRYASVVFTINLNTTVGAGSTSLPFQRSHIIARTYDLWGDRELSVSDIVGGSGSFGQLGGLVQLALAGIPEADQSLVARNAAVPSEAYTEVVLGPGGTTLVYLDAGVVAPPERGATMVSIRLPKCTNTTACPSPAE